MPVKYFPTPEDEDLIRKAQSGDTEAFEKLIKHYDRQVLSLANSYLNNPDDAQDVYQEVFLRVYRSLPKFKFQSKFSTWLYRVVMNVCITYRTQRKRHMHTSLNHMSESEDSEGLTLLDKIPSDSKTDTQALEADIESHVRTAMNVLSPQQKIVFTLRHYEGYKLREIASMMKCAEGTVKKHLFTANERLREQLRGLL